jgi:hypothetical protein
MEQFTSNSRNLKHKDTFKKIQIACCDRGSNRGPLDLDPTALPTELPGHSYKIMKCGLIHTGSPITNGSLFQGSSAQPLDHLNRK